MNLKEHLMASAERELGAFIRAVSELFGAEYAQRATEYWLEEFERTELDPVRRIPETHPEFWPVTIAATARFAAWLNGNGRCPSRCPLDGSRNLRNMSEHKFN